MRILTFFICLYCIIHHVTLKCESRDLNGGPDDVVWIVQFSDLHFSVHHPQRALDFQHLIPSALSIINPDLVFITGDLTDGKSKDLLTMKQDEKEWIEYKKVMESVIKKSGLDKNIFYDVRGNHDIFGVPVLRGAFDFFSTYSINAQLGRTGPVNSVTIQTSKRKLLFVGFDSTMSVGLRGPTNLFGHPTDKMLTELDSALSQFDNNSQFTEPITKISFGHFPLSFSAASESGKTLKDTFLKSALSTYICGHLHAKFGKNLKRHHEYSRHQGQNGVQLNSHQRDNSEFQSEKCENCSDRFGEFWEWEMGDWRKNRAMRILAIDRGYVSFLDTNFKSGTKKIFILPTFPLDSRFMVTKRNFCMYNNNLNDKCRQESSEFRIDEIRTLVFSASPISLVVARVYDSRPGRMYEVVETLMKRDNGYPSRGDLYTAPLNFRAFYDSTPDRYWLQIEATDIRGIKSLSELRPLSINGLRSKNYWTWKEFFIMGCQWSELYYPILHVFYLFTFSILVVPRAILAFSNQRYTYKNFSANGGFVNGTVWVLTETLRISPIILYLILVYLFYLILCPWLVGNVFTDGFEKGYMTYKGWVLKFEGMGKLEYSGVPDVMVVVLPHLYFVVLPAVFVIFAFGAEKGVYQDHILSLSSKKKDDYFVDRKRRGGNSRLSKLVFLGERWTRIILLLVSLGICWKHFKNCKALMKAYDMNPIVHFPLYSFSIPLLLTLTFYKTRTT